MDWENIIDNFHIELPSLNKKHRLIYDLSRILFSVSFSSAISVFSYIFYFRQNPFLGVYYVGESLVFVLSFYIFYFSIPFVVSAVGDGIELLIHKSLRGYLPNTREGKKDQINTKPFLLDTSAVIDGRFLELIKSGFIDSEIHVPKYVLNELQLIADSRSKSKRDKGRRGLEILEEIKEAAGNKFKVPNNGESVEDVDKALVDHAKEKDKRLVTADFNLNKVAKVDDVQVLNVNSLAEALKVKVLPGESLQVRIIKEGSGDKQGVGYLDDGTMVVVENGEDYIGEEVGCKVKKVIQTDAGQMIFTHITT